jgi:GNAT superfamily N-acetyltransferase
MIKVYRAQFNDIPVILPMLREFAQFALPSAAISLYPSTDEEAAVILGNFIGHHAFLVAKDGAEIVGFIAGAVSPHIFNPRIRVLTELFWWVDPKHRGTRAGLLLLESLKDWSKHFADVFIMTLESHSPVNPRTLEKRGFRHFETNYILEMR